METINIVFIHKGNSWYLPYALNQVKKSNPNANIILLGDETNVQYSKIMKHYLISDYSKKANDFANIYQHLSVAPYNYELFCIQRWFILLEFMEASNLENVMLPDTDVLIFQDVQKYFSNINSDFHHTKGTTNPMGFVYFPHRKNLKLICNFITDIYSNQDSIKNLEESYIEYKAKNEFGGISDITLFSMYEKESSYNVYNTEIPPLKGMSFIHSLESEFYKKQQNNYVKFEWKNNIPYGTLLTGERISIIGVHCFGLQKRFIRKLYQGDGKWKAHVTYLWKESLFKHFFDIIRGRK